MYSGIRDNKRVFFSEDGKELTLEEAKVELEKDTTDKAVSMEDKKSLLNEIGAY